MERNYNIASVGGGGEGEGERFEYIYLGKEDGTECEDNGCCYFSRRTGSIERRRSSFRDRIFILFLLLVSSRFVEFYRFASIFFYFSINNDHFLCICSAKKQEEAFISKNVTFIFKLL